MLNFQIISCPASLSLLALTPYSSVETVHFPLIPVGNAAESCVIRFPAVMILVGGGDFANGHHNSGACSESLSAKLLQTGSSEEP